MAHTTKGTVILGGDFNLPGVDWKTNSLKSKAADAQMCDHLISMASNNGLTQVVDEPTRGDNVLDLVFTNNPTLVNNSQIMPPLAKQADHCTVYVDINTKPQTCKQPPRKIYQYNKADWSKVKAETSKLSDQILHRADTLSTQHMWDQIEQGLQNIIENYIPSKTIKGHKNPPWFNEEIKTLFQKQTLPTENG